MGNQVSAYCFKRALKFERIFQFLLPQGCLYKGASKIWKDFVRNIVVIIQTNIFRIVGFYVRHSASDLLWNISIKKLMEDMLTIGYTLGYQSIIQSSPNFFDVFCLLDYPRSQDICRGHFLMLLAPYRSPRNMIALKEKRGIGGPLLIWTSLVWFSLMYF